MTAEPLVSPIVAHCIWCPAVSQGFDSREVHDGMEAHYRTRHAAVISSLVEDVRPEPLR